jgi:hypothetical protein
MSSNLISGISAGIAKMTMPNTNKSNFTDVISTTPDNMTVQQWIIFVIVFVLMLFILMFLGAKLFNLTIPKIIPSINKVSTAEFFGLYIILHILFC